MLTWKSAWVIEAESEMELILAAQKAKRDRLLAQLASALPKGHPMREQVEVKPVLLSDAERLAMEPIKLSLADLNLRVGPRFLSIAAVIFLALLAVPPHVFAQSLADLAKQQRDKQCSAGHTQYCDSNRKKPDVVWTAEGTANFVPVVHHDGLGDVQRTIDDIRNLTARQLGDRFAGEIQFPGRSEWESRLSAVRDRWIAAAQADLDVQKYDSTKAARNHAEYLLSLAQIGFADVEAEGTAKAMEWSRKTR